MSYGAFIVIFLLIVVACLIFFKGKEMSKEIEKAHKRIDEVADKMQEKIKEEVKKIEDELRK